MSTFKLVALIIAGFYAVMIAAILILTMVYAVGHAPGPPEICNYEAQISDPANYARWCE